VFAISKAEFIYNRDWSRLQMRTIVLEFLYYNSIRSHALVLWIPSFKQILYSNYIP